LDFGASREEGLAWRRRILAWQPQLRLLFLIEVALWKYRAKFPGYELPEPVRLAQREFDDQTANALDGMADRIEGKTPAQATDLIKPLTHLDQAIQAFRSEHPKDTLAPHVQAYIPLSAKAESLATSLDNAIREKAL
jgi:multidrug resistance protein MdtO